MKKISISAVIPTYNRRDYVCRAINSVLSQDIAPEEIIVVDDGSSDGTPEMLEEEFGSKIRLILQENSGVSAARRAGIMNANSEWIAFLDSDDEWSEDRTRLLVSAIHECEQEIDWIFGDTLIVDDFGRDNTLFQLHDLRINGSPCTFDDAIITQFPFQFSLLQSSIIRKSTIVQAGAFGQGLRGSEDFYLSFVAALRGRFAAISNVVTRLYRVSELKESSLEFQQLGGRDYYRARVMAFHEAILSGRAEPWKWLFEEAVRGEALASSRSGEAAHHLLRQQFTHGVSFKSLAFAGLGPRNWLALGDVIRKVGCIRRRSGI